MIALLMIYFIGVAVAYWIACKTKLVEEMMDESEALRRFTPDAVRVIMAITSWWIAYGYLALEFEDRFSYIKRWVTINYRLCNRRRRRNR